MPDEPTPRPGDTDSHAATFRSGVERVDETTGNVEATAPAPARPGTSADPRPPERPADPAPAAGPSGEGDRPKVTPPNRPGQSAPSSPTEADQLARRPATGVVPGVGAGARGSESPTTSGATVVTKTSTGKKVRARKVKRIVRHIEPWSVLKVSVLFYAALFLIICVASALLWSTARSTGTVENVESFITSVGGFGNCEPVDGAPTATTTTQPGATSTTAPVDQIDPTGTETTLPADAGAPADESPDDDDDCREGTELVGEFKFEDGRIFQAFVLGGIVLVLAGTAANVILTLLFNLMSDLTGGVRLTVLEEESAARRPQRSGSPPPRPRD